MTSIEWFELAEWKIIMDLKNENISFEQFCIMRELFLNQAKEMHRQEVIDAYHINPLETTWGNEGILYYQETFKNK